jgi:hypothetical protein
VTGEIPASSSIETTPERVTFPPNAARSGQPCARCQRPMYRGQTLHLDHAGPHGPHDPGR